ncbi:hypothetical protein [Streptomyces sp. 142MFCol3.1]|uniref:hypothetical protein n=1 Tax=Streptomyces sp. 142MFCol3.1 TaxID=1172179 RepID=UPI0003FA08E3|nr:hypothetical protein [Streptomyces sp. 142MFCol3.1]
MRSARKFARLAAIGAASAGLAFSFGPTASAAEQAGVWMRDGHAFTIRTSASTTAAKIVTVTSPDTRVPCTTTPCTRNNSGGSYTCWSGGPRDNDWVKVRWAGRTGWVAIMCVEGGRI